MPEDNDVPESHRNKCFVAMPFGRDQDEKRWFDGWYAHVIKPAIEAAELKPVLSTALQQPTAINDEIRKHLAFDPMVIVDLAGGNDYKLPPNPNVMYEFGIRHAFAKPVVSLALEDQRLPFDVHNQRTLVTRRDLMAIEDAKSQLTEYTRAAMDGRFYNPMAAVEREARLEIRADDPDINTGIKDLIAEISRLRSDVDRIGSRGNIPYVTFGSVKNDRIKFIKANIEVFSEKKEFMPIEKQ